MTAAVTIIPYAPEHRAAVLALLAHLWGNDHAQNDAHFNWKHERNPYASAPRLFLALQDNRVIAMRGLFASRWVDGENTRDCACLADTVVHPEYRGRGVLTALTEHIFHHAELPPGWILTLSPSAATRKVALDFGGRDIGPLRLAQLRDPAVTPALTELAAPAQAAREVDYLPVETLVRLCAETAREPRIHHSRDLAFWQWRLGSPRHRYRCFLLGEPAEGYLIQQIHTRDGVTRSRLGAWQAPTAAGLAALLAAVLADPQSSRISCCLATQSAAQHRVLAAAGFYEPAASQPDLATLLVNRVGPPADPAAAARWLDLAHWRVEMIDNDGF